MFELIIVEEEFQRLGRDWFFLVEADGLGRVLDQRVVGKLLVERGT